MKQIGTTGRIEKLQLIAERYAIIKAEFPELNDTRLVNRLHSEGIACALPDVLEALALTESDPEIAVPESDNMTAREAAVYLDISEVQFKSWWIPSVRRVAARKSDYVPVPENCPTPTRLNPTQIGRPALFTSTSIVAIKRWMMENQ